MKIQISNHVDGITIYTEDKYGDRKLFSIDNDGSPHELAELLSYIIGSNEAYTEITEEQLY